MTDYAKLLELIEEAKRQAYDIRMNIHDGDLVQYADELEAAVYKLRNAARVNAENAEGNVA